MSSDILEYPRISWNTLEYLEISFKISKYAVIFWKTLKYCGSSTCSGEQYLPMLTVEFAKKAFHSSGKKMFGGCKMFKMGSNILLMHRRHRKAEKMQGYTLVFCYYVFSKDLASFPCCQPAFSSIFSSKSQGF